MIKPITFCISTSKNEKEYIKLLLKSLRDNLKENFHEIIIFVDSDNQSTYEHLLSIKNLYPNIKICKNSNKLPVGGQRNVSIMFNAASNDIVCYLQSDMVVGKDFDLHISNNINENVVLSCARIEPPLHPPSSEKIVKDFGITPEEFRYDEFNSFVDVLQKENRPNIEEYFAPFAIYKSRWINDLGGFDTQFRCSREDSDSIIRMKLLGLETIQSWNACVYHFTCVSSRGFDWFEKTKEAEYKNLLQKHADMQELKRFIRKWGYFGHNPKPVYEIYFDVDVDRFIDINALKGIEPFCSKMYLSNKNVSIQLKSQLEFDTHYYSNLRWNYTDEYWEKVKYLFNPTDFNERICYRSSEDVIRESIYADVVAEIKCSKLMENWKEAINVIENIHAVVDNNPVGIYDTGSFVLKINNKRNLAPSMKKNKNIDLLLNDQKFDFV